ncbi:hypothetical protein FOMG_18161 [Fusarium oxysporum f. sp. melonis 26406]|uniref:3-beta hydroxysteroid dehydrogenase/isomerase domain-containing protein n=1 Tax=Fusarium oxysporum f. sp. melonis 26406 TaxID=1089452 RepID=W9ZA71_FUSOX|nr:hypothetical protein FOMG_18161 [Fusarium oxysporum f. sp. melonis 26406]
MSKGTVFLTGASGFLGSHIAAKLLTAGYGLRASFRTQRKSDDFLSFPDSNIQTCIVPDISARGAYGNNIEGCNYVIHCASPYSFKIDDIQKDLIEPAVQGTNEILSAVAAASSVKRVVLTSSFAAIINPFEGPRPGYTYTEQDWNPITLEKVGDNKIFGYLASKKLAEKAAWDFVDAQISTQNPVSLVTVCPPMIFGPAHPAAGISLSHLNESSAQLLAAVKGKNVAPARMPVFADVRDVADIHVASLNQDKVAGSERFIVCGGKYTWLAVQQLAQGETPTGETMAQADEYYSIDPFKVERMLEVQWTSLENCVGEFMSTIGL